MDIQRSVAPTRRTLLRAGGALATATALPRFAFAEDRPPLGTWPAGSAGPSVTIGITVPRTGTYAYRARTN
jgi:hypothetical protein